MRHLAFFTLLALFITIPVAPLAAQESLAIDITIYRDADSLTVFAPSAPYGIALQVTLPDGRTLTQSLVAYTAFRAAQPDVPACFRLERAGSDSPAPQDCQGIQIFIQSLTDGDVFWHDSTLNQDFTLMLVRDDQIYGVCAAGISRCTATFIPAPQEIALCDGAADLDNHEVLVVIATFRQISGNPLEPHYEWEIILDDAIAQLEGQVNARVVVIPQIIMSQEEALTISDCFNATLVIWGRVTAARVQSNYTAVARWSGIGEQPGQTNFQADQTLPQSVIDQLVIFVSLNGGDVEYILNFVLAQLIYFSENRTEAMPFLEQALNLAPNGREREMGVPAVYFYKGYIQQAFYNHLEAAISAYTNAIELEPDDELASILYNNRGFAYDDLHNYDQAVLDYAKAIEFNSELAAAYSNRGVVYYNLGDYARALADHNKAIDLDPFLAEPYNNRGNVYYSQGKYDLAIADYNQAIKLKADFVQPYNNLGVIYTEQEEYLLAIVNFKLALTINPNFASAYANRGLAYSRQGDYHQAITDYDQAIAINPSSANTYYNRGLAYANLQNYEQAIVDFSQVIALTPNDADAYNDRGIAYANQGSFTEAVADFNQVLNLIPDSVDAYGNLGIVYDMMGQANNALTAYRRYLELAGDSADPSVIARVAELEAATPIPTS